MGPYSALRPLDEALPGELDHEGWESEEDKDYRGYGWDYDPDWAPRGESPPRLGCRSVGGRGPVQDGKERSRATGGLPFGGGIGRHPQVSRECWDFAVAQGRRSPPKEEPSVAGSSPSPTGLVFGPFSALRPFDDAEPGELAGEGWSSDADWGFRGPGSGRSSPSPPRAERGHLMRTGGRSEPPPGRCQHPPGIRKRRHASISPANLHRRNNRLLTLATQEDKDFAAAQGSRSPPAEGLKTVGSSPSPTGLVFGPFSALRSFDALILESLRGRGGTLMRTGVSEVLKAADRLLVYGDTSRFHLLPHPVAATDFGPCRRRSRS